MSIEWYSQRLLNPFRGCVNCIRYHSADAVTADGVHWDIYVSNEGLLKGLPREHRPQVSDIRFGSWSVARGLRRGPIFPSEDFQRMERLGHRNRSCRRSIQNSARKARTSAAADGTRRARAAHRLGTGRHASLQPPLFREGQFLARHPAGDAGAAAAGQPRGVAERTVRTGRTGTGLVGAAHTPAGTRRTQAAAPVWMGGHSEFSGGNQAGSVCAR